MTSDAAGAGGAEGECTKELQGSVTLRSQADAEALRGVVAIQEDLEITGDVADLSPLGCLISVGGDLHVYETAALESFAGLEQLTTIGRYLAIGDGCTRREGSPCLGNRALRTFDGLDRLQSVAAIFVTAECTVGGSEGGEDCPTDAVLESIELGELTSVGDVHLRSNPALKVARFDALPALGSLDVSSNAVLETLSLAALTEAEFVEFGWNPALSSLAGLSALASVIRLTIYDGAFTSLHGLESLTTVSGWMEMTAVPGLATLEHLSSLTTLGGLQVHGAGLTDLKGLEGLTGAVPFIWLWDLPALESLEGLENVESLEALHLREIPILSSLDGLAPVTGPLEVEFTACAALSDLSALSNVTSGNHVLLKQLPALTDLDAFASLAETGELVLEDNAELANLRGMASLTELGYLAVTDNPKLPTCEAEWLRAKIGLESATISGNDDAGVCPP
jgi:hypothetical protein